MAKPAAIAAYAPTGPWVALLPPALAGTRRHSFAPLPGLTPALGAEAAAPEKQLLLTAANTVLVQRAGQRPHTGPADDLGRAPAETKPALGPVGTQALREAMADPKLKYLGDSLLQQVSDSGGRLARRVLWEQLRLLPLVQRNDHLWGYDWVSGNWGSWLHLAFSSHPNQRARARAQPLTTGWWDVDPMQREANLWLLRQQRPPGGWAWLLAELQARDSNQQKLLISVLYYWQKTEPTPLEFMPVLEKFSSEWPGYLAGEILLAMSGNALVERHWARAQSLLSYTPGARQLVVTLPTWDKAWRKDGLSLRQFSPEPVLPEGWWLLRQVLSWAHPARWTTGWNLTPTEAVDLAAANEHAAVVLAGWLEAAERYHDLNFGRPLLNYIARHPQLLYAVYPHYSHSHHVTAILFLLPLPEQAAWLLQRLLERPTALEAQQPTGEYQVPAWLEWVRVCVSREPAALLPALLPALLLHLQAYLAAPDEQGKLPLGNVFCQVLAELVEAGGLGVLPTLEAELLPLAQARPGRILANAVQQAVHLLQVRRRLAELVGTGA